MLQKCVWVLFARFISFGSRTQLPLSICLFFSVIVEYMWCVLVGFVYVSHSYIQLGSSVFFSSSLSIGEREREREREPRRILQEYRTYYDVFAHTNGSTHNLRTCACESHSHSHTIIEIQNTFQTLFNETLLVFCEKSVS